MSLNYPRLVGDSLYETVRKVLYFEGAAGCRVHYKVRIGKHEICIS